MTTPDNEKPSMAEEPKMAPPNPEEFERQHFEIALKAAFNPNCTLGMASNEWLATKDASIEIYLSGSNCEEQDEHMRPLLEEKCLRLADLSYRAVDADKSGLNVNGVPSDLRAVSRPHFMDAGSDSRCRRQMPRISRSPVGQMFDLVRQEMDVLEGIVRGSSFWRQNKEEKANPERSISSASRSASAGSKESGKGKGLREHVESRPKFCLAGSC